MIKKWELNDGTVKEKLPSILLKKVATNLEKDTENKFYGVITETENEETGEFTFALYVITPGLKDYMYRLFEARTNNFISQLPISLTLFAKDVKNNQSVTCSSYEDFESALNSFIVHPVTKLILSHLQTMAKIVSDESPNFCNLKFISGKKINTIEIEHLKSPVVVRQISLPSLLDNKSSEWIPVAMSTIVKFTLMNDVTKAKIENRVSLTRFLTPYTSRPVFDANFAFPDSSSLFMMSSDLYPKCTLQIELENTENVADVDIVLEIMTDKFKVTSF